MSDGTVGLPTDGPGKKLDTEQLTVSGETVQRERLQIAGAIDVEIASVKNSDPAASAYGLATREIGPVNPQLERLSSVDLAAGASIDLDSSAIAIGTIAKLMMVTLSSTVACRWDIKSLDLAVEVTFDTIYTSGLWGEPTRLWRPPHKEFVTIAYGDGDEGFRITVQNIDKAAADVRATVFWDEV